MAALEEFELLSAEVGADGTIDEGRGRTFLRGQSWLASILQRIQTWLPVESAEYSALDQSSNMSKSPSGHRYWTRFRRYIRSTGFGIWIAIALVPAIIIIAIIIASIFLPSYTNAPEHYQALRDRITSSDTPGRANLDKEKVFIATAIYDTKGDLARGPWGRSLLDLVDMLGPEYVFLSVYENDPDSLAVDALNEFSKEVKGNTSIVSEHLDSSALPHVTIPSGEQRLKRIAYLAEVRNRALRPLDDPASPAYSVSFDKLLFLDDIAFDPIDAANLLFSTNIDEQSGKTKYEAACAVDFINPFKFSDTSATRDAEGHSMGIPFFPWFSNSGQGQSRHDVLDQRDAVRVRSCWGGMVAFQGKWFQPDGVDTSMGVADLVVDHNATSSSAETSSMATLSTTVMTRPIESTQETESPVTSTAVDFHPEVDANLNWDLENADVAFRQKHRHIPYLPSSVSHLPLRFRESTDTFWDASERCLIHSDLASHILATSTGDQNDTSADDIGIYMNPYVRVAHGPHTLRLLAYTRRFERVYSPFHRLFDWLLGLPKFNPRRTQVAGEEVTDRVWTYNNDDWMATGNMSGSFQDVTRAALPGGFCGTRSLMALDEGIAAGAKRGRWWFEDVPDEKGD
ncbi:cryptococcal mannosyltransferase 1-domain-containing protein [Delphinella strobiligena]|nr:cryptococcal mannosyltransferase 1-domain-containing protein [Delphinella strobiligena]